MVRVGGKVPGPTVRGSKRCDKFCDLSQDSIASQPLVVGAAGEMRPQLGPGNGALRPDR